jgi:hypothetical protein
MSLPTDVSKKFWPFVIALFCIFLAMGVYGWRTTLQEAHVEPEWGMVIEQTINLVTGEEAIVVSQKHEEHWTLKVAKWGIKGVLAAALLQSGFLIFRRQIRQFAFRKVRGHQVFAGIGMNNADLALAASASGQKVAIIGEDENHPRRDELEAAGILFVSGSPTDSLKLKAAGADRSARVVVAAASGDDETIASAEIVAALSRPISPKGEKGQMLVCIESLEIRELLNQRWKLVVHPSTWQARVVSFEAAALRHIVGEAARDLALAPDIMARGPRILVVADEAFARDFLKAAIAFIQISGEQLPEYFVAVPDGKMEKAFRTLYPAVDLVAKVDFIVEEESLVPATPSLAGQKFDLAVVKLADESSTLQLADKILRSPQFVAQRVKAVVLHAPKTQFIDEPRLKIASIFEMGLKSPEFGDLELERQARENHDAYLAGLKPEERAKAQEYDALGETFKESNRWAVLHRQIKKTIWDTAPESARANLVEHLAICEHQRWMGEKVMDGWRGGKPRDNARRVHPDISTFNELSEDVKEKDRVQVRKGLGLVNQ